MKYRKLGNTDIEVSVICLGTMTWGEQNTRSEAFGQMDYAFAQGVNFFDTAELYPIPPRSDTYGQTEEIIGDWLRRTGNRERIVLASKIAGPGVGWIDHIRKGWITACGACRSSASTCISCTGRSETRISSANWDSSPLTRMN
jgi:aryl-alcohol dehydrogenase-like predicted oxidoreductase